MPELGTPIGQQTARVVVTDVDVPFWSLVALMVKWAFASIPALFVVGGVVGAIGVVVAIGYQVLLAFWKL